MTFEDVLTPGESVVLRCPSSGRRAEILRLKDKPLLWSSVHGQAFDFDPVIAEPGACVMMLQSSFIPLPAGADAESVARHFYGEPS